MTDQKISIDERNTLLLGLTGSNAYGLNTTGSDLDFKGIAFESKQQYFCNTKFEQISAWTDIVTSFDVLKQNKDTVVYGFSKWFDLAMQCNPNILELLWLPERCYVFKSELGKCLIESRSLFLSKRVMHTYSGYAYAQLKKIEKHRSWLMLGELEEPKTPNNVLTKSELGAFLEFLNVVVRQKIEGTDIDDEFKALLIKLDVKSALSQFSIPEEAFPMVQEYTRCTNDFIKLLADTQKFIKIRNDYDAWQSWKLNRNEHRAELEAKCGYDSKHAAHLIRLLRTGYEILTTGIIHVDRTETSDRDELLKIRHGEVSYDELISEANKWFELLQNANQGSSLKHKPDYNALQELRLELIENFFDQK